VFFGVNIEALTAGLTASERADRGEPPANRWPAGWPVWIYETYCLCCESRSPPAV